MIKPSDSNEQAFVINLPFYEIEVSGTTYRNSVELYFSKKHWWGIIYSWEKGQKINYASWKSGKRKHKNFLSGIKKYPFLIEQEFLLKVIKRINNLPPWIKDVIRTDLEL